MHDDASLSERASRIVDDAWAEFETSPAIAPQLRRPIDRLPDLGPENAARRARLGRSLLERIDAVDATRLPVDLRLSLGVARHSAAAWAREEEWYWLLFDPLGIGFYALFAPTAYAGAFLLTTIGEIFSTFDFRTEGDTYRYVALLHDYGRVVRQMHERTAGQALRGIVMPSLQLAGSIALVRSLRTSVPAAFRVAHERTLGVDARQLEELTERALAREVIPAFDALLATLEAPEYAAAAPATVGIGQYPGGAEAYKELVRLHTTLDVTPERVHELGLERMLRVSAGMRKLLDEIGFGGDAAAYLAAVSRDPAWRAESEEAIGFVFRRYIDRLVPHVEANFRSVPRAAPGIAALPSGLGATMTFGYYSRPTPSQNEGLYIFNAVNLAQSPLVNIAALTYHELVPGHHLHVALQQENDVLHPLRRYSFINAFNEGWAEYAATFAGELGLYASPEERFGRLMMDAFLTCRLVVDTGMNALGWSLEDARAYLREYSFMGEAEIRSETLRYACDIPGQSLAYKLGETFLFEAREKMRSALDGRFDIRDFHDAVLKPGALPLPLVGWYLDVVTRQLAQIAP